MGVIYNMKNKFLWGSALSGPQTEGNSSQNKSDSTWDYWFKHNPEKFYQQKFVKNDFIHNYKKDIDFAKQANFNSLRTSIQWTFLIPDGKNINPVAVEFYNNMINYMLKSGIEPIINLFHFDMPMWLMKIGGWTNKSSIEHFGYYAQQCFKLFGDRVKKWATFNEPIVHVECQYLYQYHYPAKESIKDALQAMWNTVMAHKQAIKIYREMNNDGIIGIILNIKLPKARSDSAADQLAAKWANIWQNSYFLNACVKGSIPEMLIKEAKLKNWFWDSSPKEEKLLKKYPVDFLGINYYQPLRIKAPTNKIEKELPNQLYYNDYQKPGIRINKSRGWEIYPEGIYESLMHIKNNYGNLPVYIAENGIGIEGERKTLKNNSDIVKDDYRINFLQEHIQQVQKAIKEGSNCFGFHMWTYIDNWSWLNTYKNRYGIVSLNIDNGERTPKKSFAWFRDFIKKEGEL